MYVEWTVNNELYVFDECGSMEKDASMDVIQ